MSKYHNTYQRIYQEKYRFLDTVTQPSLVRNRCAPIAPFNNGSSALKIIHTIDRVSGVTAVKFFPASMMPNQFQKKIIAANMNP